MCVRGVEGMVCVCEGGKYNVVSGTLISYI